MHGNKATEISIQWSLKSSLPAQNVKINHHTLYHQQPYFFGSVMTTRIMTISKVNDYHLHYYFSLFRVWSMQGREKTSTTTFQNPYKLIDSN